MVTGVGEGVGVGVGLDSVSNPPVIPTTATVIKAIRDIAIITTIAIFNLYFRSRIVMSILLRYWAVNARSSRGKGDLNRQRFSVGADDVTYKRVDYYEEQD